MKIGIIGTGAVGRIIAFFVRNSTGLDLSGICGISENQAQKLSHELGVPLLPIDELIDASDMLVEATQASAMPDIVKKIVMKSKKVMALSAGGFAFDLQLEEYIRRHKGMVYIPSGGITGIDGLLALREIGLEKVEITTLKSPGSLAGAPYFIEHGNLLENLTQKREIFRGNALEAVTAFPANANLAVTVSMAGNGLRHTMVRIIADPARKNTCQKLFARAKGCTLECTAEGEPLPENPRTSLLAANSVKAFLRCQTSAIQVGT